MWGAALSTGISWLLGGTALIVMLYVKKDPTQISLRDSFKPDMGIIRRVVKLSIPAMLECICMSLSGIVVTKSIATLARRLWRPMRCIPRQSPGPSCRPLPLPRRRPCWWASPWAHRSPSWLAKRYA